MDAQKIQEYLFKYESAPKKYEQDYFYPAICEVRLGNYSSACTWFGAALKKMLEPRTYWRMSGQPNWPVNIALLSGRTDLYPSVFEALQAYRLHGCTYEHTGGHSPVAHYCYSVMEIILPDAGNLDFWVQDLLKRPKYKDLFAAGHAFRAILEKDQTALTLSIQALLEAHTGFARHGGLRLTPEGWLCLPAMALSILAAQNHLTMDIQNEYLSLGYLDFLQHHGDRTSK
jgi:hypothetical protein